MLRRIRLIAGVCVALLALAGAARAQDFPNRPIRIVIPYAPGSVADVFARIIAQDMQEQWKGTIVVEAARTARSQPKRSRVPRPTATRGSW